jgi:hypothetical protein
VKITKRRILGLATLGLMLAPVFASSITEAVTAGTTVRALVQNNISISNTNTSNTDLTITGGTGVKQSIDKDTVTVATNDPSGYTLKLGDNDASNDLCITPGSSCTGIPAHSGTFASPSLMSAANLWGYHIDDGTTTWCSTATNCGAALTLPVNSAATSTTLKFAKVKVNGSEDTIKTTSSTTAGDNTIFYYGVNVDAALTAGTYSDAITYTATAN